MGFIVLRFALSAAAIFIAGSFLTRFADELAEITGLGRLVIGSVLLAGATSLPELSVDVTAIRMQLPNLAVGDLLGSCLMNLLILAALDLTQGSHRRMLSRQAAAHALAGLLSIALMCVAGLSLLTANVSREYLILGIGPGMLLVIITYVLGVRVIYIDQRIAAKATPSKGAKTEANKVSPSAWRAVIGFAICALTIFFAGPQLARAADEMAARTGLGHTFVGTTLVALSTSLPELVSMFAAIRLGAYDLAIGNVFGSNAFNMLLLAALDFFQAGSLMAAVSPLHAVTCLSAVLATTVAVMGQLYHEDSRVRLIEPDAWLVILIVGGALTLVYYMPT